ncbi:DUF2683 family protein [Flavobacterium sp.]|uniref:DUF2683 family protein n=1 Tax=Flavobacterium sp. TaxID=239 RepID=UPI003751DEC8
MTTITLKIDERTKKGKAFLALAKVFYDEKNEVELVKEKDTSPYNPEFVAKINKARMEKGKVMNSVNELWESIQ